MVKLYVIQALRIYPAFIMLKFKRMEVIVACEHQRHVMTKLQYCFSGVGRGGGNSSA